MSHSNTELIWSVWYFVKRNKHIDGNRTLSLCCSFSVSLFEATITSDSVTTENLSHYVDNVVATASSLESRMPSKRLILRHIKTNLVRGHIKKRFYRIDGIFVISTVAIDVVSRTGGDTYLWHYCACDISNLPEKQAVDRAQRDNRRQGSIFV